MLYAFDIIIHRKKKKNRKQEVVLYFTPTNVGTTSPYLIRFNSHFPKDSKIIIKIND